MLKKRQKTRFLALFSAKQPKKRLFFVKKQAENHQKFKALNRFVSFVVQFEKENLKSSSNQHLNYSPDSPFHSPHSKAIFPRPHHSAIPISLRRRNFAWRSLFSF